MIRGRSYIISSRTLCGTSPPLSRSQNSTEPAIAQGVLEKFEIFFLLALTLRSFSFFVASSSLIVKFKREKIFKIFLRSSLHSVRTRALLSVGQGQRHTAQG